MSRLLGDALLTAGSGVAVALAFETSAGAVLGGVAGVPWLIVMARCGAAAATFHLVLLNLVVGATVGRWIPASLEMMGASGPVSILLWAGSVGLEILPRTLLLGLAAHLLAVPRPMLFVGGASLGAWLLELGYAASPFTPPWVPLGHLQAWNPGVAQLAAAGGVPVVSGAVAAVHAAIAVLWIHRRSGRGRSLAMGILAGWAAVSVAGRGLAEWFQPLASKEYRVLLVQPDLPYDERWAPGSQRTNLREIADQSRAGLHSDGAPTPHVMLWPETSLTTPPEDDPVLRSELLDVVRELGVPLVAGVIRPPRSRDPAWYRNAAVWIDPQQGFLAWSEKVRRVPFAETPFGTGSAPKTARNRWVERGRTIGALGSRPALGVFFCFEASDARLVARRASGVDALVNLVNDSWFAGELVSHYQILAARFRAIENRAWVLRVAHGGISASIDPFGRVQARRPFGERGTLRVSFSPRVEPSALQRAAPGLVAVLVGIAAGWLTRSFLR